MSKGPKIYSFRHFVIMEVVFGLRGFTTQYTVQTFQVSPAASARCTAPDATLTAARHQGLTLVHFSGYRSHFQVMRWVVSWSFGDESGSG